MKKFVLCGIIVAILMTATACGNTNRHKNDGVFKRETTGYHKASDDAEVEAIMDEIMIDLAKTTGDDMQIIGYEYIIKEDVLEVCYEDQSTNVRYIEYIHFK